MGNLIDREPFCKWKSSQFSLFTGKLAGCPAFQAGRAVTDSRSGVKLHALKGAASR
jgi:hypothetical protein